MATVETENVTAAEPDPEGSAGFRPVRITVDLYDRMVKAGVFGSKSSIILWNGRLVEKVADMSKGPPHGYALNRLARLLPGVIPEGYFSEQDQPVGLGTDGVPEPDLKVVRGAGADYRARTPQARDVPLVVEVSDSSLADDTGEMLRAYAAAAIPVYWVVNLPGRRADVYTGPSGPTHAPGYAARQSYHPGAAVPVVLDGREVGMVAVDDVLP